MRISNWSSDVWSSELGSDLPGSVLFAVNIVTNSSASSGAIVGVDTLFVDDITESKSAEDAAAASVTATATAVAARDDAEIFAGAAHDSEVARSEEHTSELQSLMRISYAVFCLKKKNTPKCYPTNYD